MKPIPKTEQLLDMKRKGKEEKVQRFGSPQELFNKYKMNARIITEKNPEHLQRIRLRLGGKNGEMQQMNHYVTFVVDTT